MKTALIPRPREPVPVPPPSKNRWGPLTIGSRSTSCRRGWSDWQKDLKGVIAFAKREGFAGVDVGRDGDTAGRAVAAGHAERVARVPNGYVVTAWRPESPVDALEHARLPVFSVQFHPEAREGFLTRISSTPPFATVSSGMSRS